MSVSSEMPFKEMAAKAWCKPQPASGSTTRVTEAFLVIADHFHSPIVTVQVTVESWRSTAWRISLTWTALLLLLVLLRLGHCSIPHGHVVIVATVRSIGIFASGNLRLLTRYGAVLWV